jgi:GTP-binding protein
MNTLIDYRYQQHFKAKTGGHAWAATWPAPIRRMSCSRFPWHGYPRGGQRNVIADLGLEPGQRVRLAQGGNGGFGNTHFKSP